MSLFTHLETLALALLLFAALGGWTLVGPVKGRAERGALLVLAAAASFAFAWTARSYRAPPIVEEEVTSRPIEVQDAGFVSSETCRSCHPRHYETWHLSYHRTMTQVARPDTVLADFDGRRLTHYGDSYRLEEHEGGLWLEIEAGGNVGTRRPVVLTTGSHHMQLYWYATGEGRNLGMLPFAYLVEEDRWAPRDALFIQPPRDMDIPETGRWNHTCLKCHTTQGQPRLQQLDTRVAEFGIACEACHGPGEEHVATNRDPRRRYRLHRDGDEGDPTVAHPPRMNAARSSQVCGRCHAVAIPGDEEFAHFLTTGFSFRPGEDLNDKFAVFQPSQGLENVKEYLEFDPQAMEKAFWSDGMIRLAGREYNGLIDSPCFKGGEFGCLSCHVLHQEEDDPRPTSEWAVDQLKPGMRGDAACTSCHAEYEAPAVVAAHSRHQADSTGSRCYNCHMTHTSYGLLKAVRSHQVSNPSVASSLETGRPNACNLCHLDKTLAWSAGYLEDWYDVPTPALGEIERGVPAALIWLLSGDAGQRALAAWSMGWEPAVTVSGGPWMAPFLAQLLVDPYDAVRFIASRSLKRMAGFEDFEYDFVGPSEDRHAAGRQAAERWWNTKPESGRVHNAQALLDDPDGLLPPDVFRQLVRQRDNRHVFFQE